MTLTAHILAGAAVGTGLNSVGAPLWVSILGSFFSHYLLDSIPHACYKLPSIESPINTENRSVKLNNPQVKKDLIKILVDFSTGLLIVMLIALITKQSIDFLILWGFLGALPDGLQGIQLFYKKFPINFFQKFHSIFHYENNGSDLQLTTRNTIFQIIPILPLVFLLFT